MNLDEKKLYVDSAAYNQAITVAARCVGIARAEQDWAMNQGAELLEALEEIGEEPDQAKREALALKVSMNAYQMAAPQSPVSQMTLKYIQSYPWQSISDVWHKNREMLEEQEEDLEKEFFSGRLSRDELIRKAGELKFEYDNLGKIGGTYAEMKYILPHELN